jgi:hypothetical protein
VIRINGLDPANTQLLSDLIGHSEITLGLVMATRYA